jgi:hypothetical protein
MMYYAEMGPGATMYIPSFRKTGSAIEKLIGGYTDTQTAWWPHKSVSLSKEPNIVGVSPIA